VLAIPDTIDDALTFKPAAALIGAVLAVQEAVESAGSEIAEIKALVPSLPITTGLIDELKNAAAPIRGAMPSALTAVKFLFQALGLDDLVKLPDLQGTVATLDTAISSLQAAHASTDAVAAFQGVRDTLASLTNVSSVLDLDPAALARLVDRFGKALDDFRTELSGDAAKQAALDALDGVFASLGDAFPGLPRPAIRRQTGGARSLQFGLHFQLDKTPTLGLDFSIDAGVLGLLPFSVETGGQIDVTLGAALDLGFGLDFAALGCPVADAFFLDPASRFELTALINATNLTATVKLGGIGAMLGPGTLALQKDVNDAATDDRATLRVTLDGDAARQRRRPDHPRRARREPRRLRHRGAEARRAGDGRRRSAQAPTLTRGPSTT